MGIQPVNICIVDHASLMQDAKLTLADLGYECAVILPNSENIMNQVRGRSILHVYLFGLDEGDINLKLKESIDAAQVTLKRASYDCRYICLD